ncbi:MAG: hypothetical protein V4689_21250 [Verrucomicrobiota bacterium]
MMKILKHTALVFASLFLAGLGSAFAGSAWFAPTKDFYDRAALVVIVDVKKVTKVEVSTGDGQSSDVYVAEAEVLQTLKSDHNPTPEKRKIAIVGSTIPMSSAVWEPIESKRYLAFLNPEQGHYRYSEKYAMRPISPAGKVAWIEKNAKGDYELLAIDIEEAVRRIRNEQDGGGQPATRPESK